MNTLRAIVEALWGSIAAFFAPNAACEEMNNIDTTPSADEQ